MSNFNSKKSNENEVFDLNLNQNNSKIQNLNSTIKNDYSLKHSLSLNSSNVLSNQSKTNFATINDKILVNEQENDNKTDRKLNKNELEIKVNSEKEISSPQVIEKIHVMSENDFYPLLISPNKNK